VDALDTVDAALASLDDESARRAGPAIDTLIGGAGERMPVESLTRLMLQDFLWFKLPTHWLTDDHDHHEVAWALGDLFQALGLERYAAVCRDRHTHEILAAWHRDPDEGERLAADATARSGLLPPDTETLSFGEVMGNVELQVYLDVAAVIEHAVDGGELDPAASTFERDRARVIERFLSTPLEGQSPVSAVRRERAEAWAAEFRGDVGWADAALRSPEGPPENVELSLAPARAVLEAVGLGLPLTASGYLPPPVVLTLNDHFRWSDIVGKPPKKEADLPPLKFLREHLVQQRLLTVRRGTITVSARGRRCLEDDTAFWEALTDLRPRWGEFEREVLATAGAMLVEDSEQSPDEVSRAVAAKIRGRWKGGSDDLAGDIYWVFIDWYRVGIPLGWWDAKKGRWVYRLTARGVAAAARAFRSVATAPARS
jgi:hypothetical protein